MRASKRDQSPSTLPPTAPTETQQWAILSWHSTETHANFSSFFHSFELLFNMPRGRPKWKANDTRDHPAIRRRLTEPHSSTPAQLSTHAGVEEVSQANDEAAQVTHEAARAQTRGTCRWDAGRPANWSMATLRRRIEEHGIKPPAGMKKAQLLRMYFDNFCGDDEIDEPVTMDESMTMPSASSGSDRTDTRPTPTPTTRWGITADLNGFATRAGQRHQPLASPRTGVTHVPSHDRDSCSREPCSRRTTGNNQTRQCARDGAIDGCSAKPTAGDVSDDAADGRDYSFSERPARILSSCRLIRRHSTNDPRPEHRADYAELSTTQRVQLDDSHRDDRAVDRGVVALRSRRHLQMAAMSEKRRRFEESARRRDGVTGPESSNP